MRKEGYDKSKIAKMAQNKIILKETKEERKLSLLLFRLLEDIET